MFFPAYCEGEDWKFTTNGAQDGNIARFININFEYYEGLYSSSLCVWRHFRLRHVNGSPSHEPIVYANRGMRARIPNGKSWRRDTPVA